MPIELRPSDVMFQAAEAFGKWSQVAGQIHAAEYEKQRVREVNSALVTLEETFQKQIEDYPQSAVEVYPETEGKSAGEIEGVGPTLMPFGQLPLSALQQDYNKRVKALEDHIRLTVHNKRAREEMLSHLAMGAVQQWGRVTGLWKRASQAHEAAGLQDLTDTEMRNVPSLGSAVVVARIQDRVTQMFVAGMIEEDKAQEFMSKVTAQAEYVEGYGKMLEEMTKNGPEISEKWLKENTPFWDDEPDTRAKVLQEVRSEWDTRGRLKDAGFDRELEEDNMKIDSVDGCLAALKKLGTMAFHDGDKKRQWQDYFMRKLEVEENKLAVPAAKIEDVQKQNLGAAKWNIEMMKLDGKTKEEQLEWLLKYSHSYPMEMGAAAELLKYISAEQSLGLKYGLQYLKDNKKLTPSDEMRIGLQLEELLKTPEGRDMKTTDITKAVDNWIKEKTFAKLDSILGANKEVILPDKLNISRVEAWTRDIQEGNLTGRIEELQGDLDIYNASMVKLARTRYPHLDIRTARTDSDGKTTGLYGTAILLDNDFNPYYFKLVGKELELYGYLRTATRAGQGALGAPEGAPVVGGTREWRLIELPRKTGAEEAIQKAEEKAANKEAIKADIEGGKQLEKEAREKFGPRR